jgi:hypothetical protein
VCFGGVSQLLLSRIGEFSQRGPLLRERSQAPLDFGALRVLRVD